MLLPLLLSCAPGIRAEGGAAAALPPDEILLLVGPEKHPPGTHEVAAGARLLQYCIEHVEPGRRFRTVIRTEWPDDPIALARVRVVVFTGDQFPPVRMDRSAEIRADLARLVGRGCGLVCIHFATGLQRNLAPPDIQAELHRWLGGFGCFRAEPPEVSSVARIMPATITPAAVEHPVLRGVGAFSLYDEPYYKIRFVPAETHGIVTHLATAMLPPEAPQRETVAWCLEGEDGHRAVSVVLPHFFVNWEIGDLRKMILNGIFWAARAEIPATGIESTLPPLETFQPKAVRFQAPAPKAPPQG